MINELKVFYKGEKGLVTFNNKKTVFQHRLDRDGVKYGLGILKEGSLFDKGNYAFAVFENVATVVPKMYSNIAFFSNKGVPTKIEKGMYGDNVLLKETYKDRTYIRAYKVDGSMGLYESKIIKNDEYEGPNVYFNRLEDLIEKWEDITDEIIKSIIESVKSLKCNLSLSNEVVLTALKGLGKNEIYKLDSGVIVADGKFESLIIWDEGAEVKMAWLGRKLDFSEFTYENVTKELINLLKSFNSKAE